MSRFTSGFETVHLPKGNLRGSSRNNVRIKSNMFDSGNTTLSASTRKLVETLSKRAGLSKRQMKRLGDLSSKGYKSKPVIQQKPRRCKPKRVTLPSRPLRKPRPVEIDRAERERDDLRRNGLKAKKLSQRRERHKIKSQDSYLTQFRVGHRYFDRLDSSETSKICDTPSARPKKKKDEELNLATIFSRITLEIKEREEFMKKMREMKSLSRDRELELRGEILERIKELEALDKLIENT